MGMYVEAKRMLRWDASLRREGNLSASIRHFAMYLIPGVPRIAASNQKTGARHIRSSREDLLARRIPSRLGARMYVRDKFIVLITLARGL